MHEVNILLSGEPAFLEVFKHLITITTRAGCSRQVYSLSRIFTWLLLSHWYLAILSRLRCRFILQSLTSSDDLLCVVVMSGSGVNHPVWQPMSHPCGVGLLICYQPSSSSIIVLRVGAALTTQCGNPCPTHLESVSCVRSICMSGSGVNHPVWRPMSHPFGGSCHEWKRHQIWLSPVPPIWSYLLCNNHFNNC